MFGIQGRSWTALLLGGVVVVAATVPLVAANRAPAEIIKELDAIKPPQLDPSRQAEPGYIAQLRKAFAEVGVKRDALIMELFEADPSHDRLPELMTEHWRRMPPIGPSAAKLEQEIKDVLARTHNEKLKTEAMFARAQTGLIKARESGSDEFAEVDQFVHDYPKDPRAGLLLYFASQVASKPAVKRAYEDRVLKEFPKSQVADAITGNRRKFEAIGKPFELEFNDAITGTKISMKDLKGKAVVIDFWATWCGPCVAELPHMKDLYAKYHDRGVEFIGVSLDQPVEEGGLERLKEFVKQREIKWPQYYMGKGWESDFSRSWGINAIPAVFVVDTEGNLYSIEARGKLDKMIPKLLGITENQENKSPANGQ